jgi:hypothetical protein
MSFTERDRQQLSYEEIVAIVRGMPTKEQQRLAEELRRAGLKAKWDEILAVFMPNSMSEREIVRTCKEVRRELWEKRRNEGAPDRR